MTFILLLSCSDYGIKEQVEPVSSDTGEGRPMLSVSPDNLDLGIICAAQENVFELSNVGTAPLSILNVNIDSTTWQLPELELPIVLDVAETYPLPITGGIGTATLVIESTDSETPQIEIPLFALENTPPTIEVIEPADNSVLNGGETFQALVLDDRDVSPNLSAQWRSSVDGFFGSTNTDGNGYLNAYWSTNHTAGQHSIGLRAVDGCGAETSTLLSICHQSSYSIDNLDLSTWQLEGVAEWDANNAWLQITDAQSTTVGAAFQTNQTVSAKEVELSFQFYIGEGSGADGFAIVALDTQRMSGYIGSAGGCLGYGNGGGCEPLQAALPGWVIEIDTYYNGQWDPTEADHIAFMFDGQQDQIEAWAELPELEDTGWHDMTILVNEPRVTVTIDGAVVLDLDIPGYYDFPAYIGFTGATGGLTNKHLIKALSVTETSCPSE